MNNTNSTNNNTSAAAAAAQSASQLPQMGRSLKAQEARDTAKVWMNKYLSSGSDLSTQEYTNTSYPHNLNELTFEYLEGDRMPIFLNAFGLWLSANKFKTRIKTWLAPTVKVDYFKNAKEVLKDMFPEHTLFLAGRTDDWFIELKKKMEKQCNRTKSEDPEQTEERKSEPLYRDVSTDRTVTRAKYLNDTPVDAKSIAMLMIKKMNHKWARSLCEFTMTRVAIGRGGEMAFVRWNEGAYDHYFQGADFDWNIIKQLDKQCMLMYCDLELYCLCPYFAFGVYFLFGNLRRENVEDHQTDFVFPHLSSVQKESVAARLTADMRLNIEDKNRKGNFTSKSIKKGVMTQNRANPDLSLKEEYARSGHTGSETNSNAEGYIVATPAMSHPGAMAVAGYSNCHMIASPYSFDILGFQAADSVNRLLDKLFIIDVPQLQRDGNLWPIVLTAAARLVGSYASLTKDVSSDNSIIVKIDEAAKKANIDDSSVPQGVGPRHKLVLMSWSKKIEEDFKSKNQQRPVQDDPSMANQVSALGAQMQANNKKIDNMAGQVAECVALKSSIDSLVACFQQQQQELKQKELQLAEKERQNSKLQSDNTRLRRSIQAMLMNSPSRGANDTTVDDFIGEPEAKRARVEDSASAPLPPAQKSPPPLANISQVETSRMPHASTTTLATSTSTAETLPTTTATVAAPAPAPALTLMAALNGNPPKGVGKVGGLHVVDMLEWLIGGGILKKQQAKAESNDIERLDKSILFKNSHDYFVGHHPKFDKEMAKFRYGMTFVALAIDDRQWDAILGMEKDDAQMIRPRRMFANIDAKAMSVAASLEMEFGLRESAKTRHKSTIHSLGTRYIALERAWKDLYHKSEVEIENLIEERVNGRQGQQSTLSDFFASRS